MIGKKIPDKITSLGKTKSKGKGKEKEQQEIYIPSEKKPSKLLMTWDCFKHHIKMKYQKITNLLDTTLDEIPRFITNNG